MNDVAVVAALACAGAAVGWAGGRAALVKPPASLLRTNVSGARVPVVLGAWVVAGGVTAILLLAVLTEVRGWELTPDRVTGSALVVLVVMGVAGRWDDLRGDERARGFAGHLAAAGGGRLTGGMVKIAAALGAGYAASMLLHPWDPLMTVLTVAAIGLAANLVNLFDRAPGRAGKVALSGGLLLVLFGSPSWAIAAAGTLGALAAVLPADLGERGMLGDAGANPLGALVGLGLVVSLPVPALGAAVTVLLALNLASEKWSFSEVIARTPALRALDGIGRK